MFAFVADDDAVVVVEKEEVPVTERVPLKVRDGTESDPTLSVWIFAV